MLCSVHFVTPAHVTSIIPPCLSQDSWSLHSSERVTWSDIAVILGIITCYQVRQYIVIIISSITIHNQYPNSMATPKPCCLGLYDPLCYLPHLHRSFRTGTREALYYNTLS